jgi:hypothetical protein
LLDAFRTTVRDWESDADGLMLSYIGKMPGMAVRLSLILASMEWASGEGDEPREIGVQHFGRAAHFIEVYALPMARRAYADGSVPAAERAARRLVNIIRDEGWQEFTHRQVARRRPIGPMGRVRMLNGMPMLSVGSPPPAMVLSPCYSDGVRRARARLRPR